MEDMSDIKKLDDGKYSFVVGRQRYTLSTPLKEEHFSRVVRTVQDVVSSFPPHLSQEERLFLGLMAISNETANIALKLEKLVNTLEKEDD
ncbi:MAG: hypothetical protein GXZ18_03425 [Synergistaceae bacterium]|nr:hypothetical protein [Synergistaceae bacterium]